MAAWVMAGDCLPDFELHMRVIVALWLLQSQAGRTSVAILRRYLWDTTKDYNQDWWDLCYDDVRREFYVEHRWHHMNIKNILEPPYKGNEHILIRSYDGPCWWLIDDLEDKLLEEAGHV